MIKNVKANDTTNVNANYTKYDKMMKSRGRFREPTGKRVTQQSIFDLLTRFQEYVNEDFDNHILNSKLNDTRYHDKLASYLKETLGYPRNSKCENVDKTVYIRYEEEQKPISESCWREIENNGFEL